MDATTALPGEACDQDCTNLAASLRARADDLDNAAAMRYRSLRALGLAVQDAARRAEGQARLDLALALGVADRPRQPQPERVPEHDSRG